MGLWIIATLMCCGAAASDRAERAILTSFETCDCAKDPSRATPRDEWHPSQDTFNVKELSEYRLTDPVFKQFVHASKLIVTASQEDPRLANDPLFTRDVSVLDDVVASAERVEARLKFEPRYTSALR